MTDGKLLSWGERRVNDAGIEVVWARGFRFPVYGDSGRRSAPGGALAVDERQGDQWGWAVDYETASAAQERALGECGSGCSVVLTFGRCAAYASDQDADSTAVGWAEAYATGSAAQQSALSECRSRGGGSGCIVRAWGCNGPVVEEGLSLDLAARRRIQQGLAAGGFDPGGADGLFGPRTRAAIRRWQSSRGGLATGYLDGASAEALRSTGAAGPAGDGVCAVCAWGGPRGAAVFAGALAGRRGVGRLVLAVDHEQHEPCGVRGVSASVPERAVQRAGAGACGGAAPAGGFCARGNRDARGRGGVAGSRRVSGLRRACAGPLAQQPAGTCARVPARSSGTAPSARRWWCRRAALWRWVATR